MSLFFSVSDLQRAQNKLGEASPWPDFNADFLLQKPSQISIHERGILLYGIGCFDGEKFVRTVTADTKFLSWLITGCSVARALGLGESYFDSAREWVALLLDAPFWDSTQSGDPQISRHVDLRYGNNAYACAVFLDLCGEDCDQEFRFRLISKMIEQARLGQARFSRRPLESHPFTQNHFFIPFTGYLCLCLSLRSHWEEAEGLIAELKPFIPLIFENLGQDGWYYEGIDYCHFAFIWLIRLADLSERHLGQVVHRAPCLTGLPEFFRRTSFPKGKSVFAIGDNSDKQWSLSSWTETDPALANHRINNFSHLLYWIGWKTGQTGFRSVADEIHSRGVFWQEGFWTLFWEAPIGTTCPHSTHLFEDFGVWAADLKDEAGNTLRILAKCGPPMGHHQPLTPEGMPAYHFNAGHVHPDAGSVFAAWNDLPVILGPGYLGRKAGTYLNSITIDGQGQENDRLYHAFEPEHMDYQRLKSLAVSDSGHTASLDFASAYSAELGMEVGVRKVEPRSASVFEIEDTVHLSKPGHIEARYRISDPPHLCHSRLLEWSVCNQRMRFEVLEASCDFRIWVYPGEVVTINDGFSPGPLEAGNTHQRGYQILLRTTERQSVVKWRVCFSVLED